MINVCEILGTEYPIIQGAMARIAECNLAAAVSNGGGLALSHPVAKALTG